MNKYNPGLYYQSTSFKTTGYCAELQETGDVGTVIEHIGKRFYKQSSDSSNTTEAKAKERKDLHLLYTHENIEKENEAFLANGTCSRKNMEIYYELYRASLKLVLDYCETNSNLSDYQSFCIYFFLGNLYTRMPEFTSASKAGENYAKAFTYAAKLQELDPSAVLESLSKHRAICASDGVDYYDVSIEDALLSVTYVDRNLYPVLDSLEGLSDITIRNIDDLSLYGLNDLPKLFTSIGCTKFSKLVLTVNALDALSHNRFKILFVDEIKKKTSMGNYNQKNTVRIRGTRGREKIRGTLFHELTHKTMNRVFDNKCIPYFSKDQNAKQAYRESMKQVLLNLISFSDVSLTHVTELPFNELIQFCFGEEYQFLVDAIKEKNEPYMLDLCNRLLTVFGEGYLVSHLDIEFITNTLQYLINVENDSVYVRCVQPLLDYIDKFVIPAIEKYIAEHPCMIRGRLKV